MNSRFSFLNVPSGKRELPITLKLEIQRVNLLYEQNIRGVIALLIYSSSYLYASWGIIDSNFLKIWYSILITSAIIRIIATYRWKYARNIIESPAQIQFWMRLIQSLLFISGIGWGAIGWIFTASPSPHQQIFTALSIVFMSAGALVCYSASLAAVFLVLLPAMIPWTIGLLLADSFIFRLMGFLCAIYTFLGFQVGKTLNRYVDSSLRLNVENSELTSTLKTQIVIQEKARRQLAESEESLRFALDSSHAFSWCWREQGNIFSCKGNLKDSIGIDAEYFSGTLNDILNLIQSDERFEFSKSLQAALEGYEELDIERRILWPDGSIHDIAFRGKTRSIHSSEINGIAWDVTAKKKALRMQRERDVHEAASTAKSALLANASHEIRTPLTVINGFAETLLQMENLPQEAKAEIQTIARNGKYLNSLVNNLLDLAKIDTGQLYLQKGLMSPVQEINECLSLMKSTLEIKGLELKIVYESELPDLIESDAVRFRQIFISLLSNAVQFSSKGVCTVRVCYEPLGLNMGTLNIKVADTGIGMSAEQERRLFEPFRKGSDSTSKKNRGSGLGLALAKNLAVLLGGDLRLLRTKENEGSEFEWTQSVRIADNGVKATNKEAGGNETKNLMGKNILVVDDSDDLRSLLGLNLRRQGMHVETCGNGLEAITRVQNHHFDLILMDINMPVMNGYEATSMLRQRGYTYPIVALTAHASFEDRKLCYQAGCDAYLSKPVDFQHLYDVIQNQVARVQSIENELF